LPENWKKLLWNIAYTFSFQASEIWEMDISELFFWNEGIEFIGKQMRQ